MLSTDFTVYTMDAYFLLIVSSNLASTVILINLCVLGDKNKKFNKFFIKILYMSIFFRIFEAKFVVRICMCIHVHNAKKYEEFADREVNIPSSVRLITD